MRRESTDKNRQIMPLLRGPGEYSGPNYEGYRITRRTMDQFYTTFVPTLYPGGKSGGQGKGEKNPSFSIQIFRINSTTSDRCEK